MPYNILPVGNNRYAVVNPNSGKIHSTHTTLKNAEAQKRLLYVVESGKRGPTHTLSHLPRRRRHESVLTR